MFSEELYMPDRNTERYMFDEMQNELDEMRSDLAETRGKLTDAKNDLVETQNNLAETQNNLTETQSSLNRMNDKYEQAVRNGVEVMRSLGLSDTEIINKLRTQYQFGEAQAKEYL